MKINKNLLTLLVIGAFAVPPVKGMHESSFHIPSNAEVAEDEKHYNVVSKEDIEPDLITRLKSYKNPPISNVPVDELLFTKDLTQDQTPAQGFMNRWNNSSNKSSLRTVFKNHASNDQAPDLTLSNDPESDEGDQAAKFKNLDNDDQQALVRTWQQAHDQRTKERMTTNALIHHNRMMQLKSEYQPVRANIQNLRAQIDNNYTKIQKITASPLTANVAERQELERANQQNELKIQTALSNFRQKIQEAENLYNYNNKNAHQAHVQKNS